MIRAPWHWLIRPWHKPRRFMAFGIAAPRSGAHSLCAVLAPACRTAHRLTPAELIALTLDRASGKASREQVRQWLLRRDRWLSLEFETSNLLDPFFEDLVAIFPEARFILPIRHPAQWLRSYMNFQLNAPSDGREGRPIWVLRPHRFGPADADRPAAETPLAALGLFPVERYLSWWAEYHRRAIDIIPADRLLVYRTDELAARLAEIADFLGLDRGLLDATQTHAARARKYRGVVDVLPPGYVDECVQKHAADLMARFFG